MKPIRQKEAVKQIESQGYHECKTGGGSHKIYRADGKPTLSIPNEREIAPGTWRNILKLLGG
jgi:predicted RNA binding protein YcfA (HicA-like mRNA interferase family)